MAVVFVLGPSDWRRRRKGATPLEIRRRLAQRLADHHHYPIVMEDVPDEAGDKDAFGKFTRILDTMGVTDILLWHPAGAKMQATIHELVLLIQRADDKAVPRLWLLVQTKAASLDAEHFTVKERGLGSSYLDAVFRLRPIILDWVDAERLDELVDHVATEI